MGNGMDTDAAAAAAVDVGGGGGEVVTFDGKGTRGGKAVVAVVGGQRGDGVETKTGDPTEPMSNTAPGRGRAVCMAGNIGEEEAAAGAVGCGVDRPGKADVVSSGVLAEDGCLRFRLLVRGSFPRRVAFGGESLEGCWRAERAAAVLRGDLLGWCSCCCGCSGLGGWRAVRSRSDNALVAFSMSTAYGIITYATSAFEAA
mmetsp:Transcript_44881/g.73112  ORF Transcript_44881/g.73112 Transcript_44881/m.73112 type:complete len:200 (+) Transcript_44881:173-772(+)